MEVAIAVPIHSMDFNFHSNCSSPFFTAPSTPQQQQQKNVDANTKRFDFDFEFEFSGQLQTPSLSAADELFDRGMIRPLNTNTNRASSIDQPPLPKGSTHEGLRDSYREEKPHPEQQKQSDDSKKDKKGFSSLFSESAISSFLSSIWFRKGYRKWRIKDILLFRSASEGRYKDNDAFRKYVVLSKTKSHYDEDDDVGNLSFRSTTTAAEENSGSVSKRRVSAHELHYTVNRAASEEMKKKTLLPYKHGLLGCLSFNATSDLHLISSRVMSMERS